MNGLVRVIEAVASNTVNELRVTDAVSFADSATDAAPFVDSAPSEDVSTNTEAFPTVDTLCKKFTWYVLQMNAD